MTLARDLDAASFRKRWNVRGSSTPGCIFSYLCSFCLLVSCSVRSTLTSLRGTLVAVWDRFKFRLSLCRATLLEARFLSGLERKVRRRSLSREGAASPPLVGRVEARALSRLGSVPST